MANEEWSLRSSGAGPSATQRRAVASLLVGAALIAISVAPVPGRPVIPVAQVPFFALGVIALIHSVLLFARPLELKDVIASRGRIVAIGSMRSREFAACRDAALVISRGVWGATLQLSSAAGSGSRCTVSNNAIPLLSQLWSSHT